ncbi:hypothetical protein [Glycomyces sp. NPDC048151]|uniref:hypothetical protein n=1 Tax=Glycomyces sp. NPDC048151 TaxID=3364002 RepID=UPI0037159DEF
MSTFTLGGMSFRAHTATDPSSRESITWIYRTDLHPEAPVAHVHDYGVYIQPKHRYLDEDVLKAAVDDSAKAAA